MWTSQRGMSSKTVLGGTNAKKTALTLRIQLTDGSLPDSVAFPVTTPTHIVDELWRLALECQTLALECQVSFYG
jgi:hypothetical protein